MSNHGEIVHIRRTRLCITERFGGNLDVSLCITLCMMWIDMRICIEMNAYAKNCIYIAPACKIRKNVSRWGNRSEIYGVFCE
jgi:hypothetical protein